jgi:hypothetical protein
MLVLYKSGDDASRFSFQISTIDFSHFKFSLNFNITYLPAILFFSQAKYKRYPPQIPVDFGEAFVFHQCITALT